MRAYEGRVGPRRPPERHARRRRETRRRGGPEDLAALDWTGRCGRRAQRVDRRRRRRDPLGAGPATWTSVAVKGRAPPPRRSASPSPAGSKTALDLPPKERVALAAALSCAACDAEAWGEHLKAKTESTRAAHNMGHLPLAPRGAKPETGRDRRRRGRSDASAAAAETSRLGRNAHRVGAKASDRESPFLRHRPIARDELRARAYHVLGGSAGAGTFRPETDAGGGSRATHLPDSDDEADVPAPAGSGSGRGEDRGREWPGGSRAPRLVRGGEVGASRERRFVQSRRSLARRSRTVRRAGTFPPRPAPSTTGPRDGAASPWVLRSGR